MGGGIFKPWWTKVMADRWIDEESSQGHETPSLTIQLSVVFIFFLNISRTFWEQATSCFKSFSSLLQFFLSTDKTTVTYNTVPVYSTSLGWIDQYISTEHYYRNICTYKTSVRPAKIFNFVGIDLNSHTFHIESILL